MAGESQAAELEVTAEEERFLKRFFRRQVRPYLLLVLVIAVTAVWWLPSGNENVRAKANAEKITSLRAQGDQLRAEVAALARRVETQVASSDRGTDELERRVRDARRSVRMIESRVTAALDRRIDELESRVAKSGTSRASFGAPPPEAATWDVGAILDRLYNLELRQENEQRSDVTRIARLEERLSHLEASLGMGSTPAAVADP